MKAEIELPTRQLWNEYHNVCNFGAAIAGTARIFRMELVQLFSCPFQRDSRHAQRQLLHRLLR